MGGLKLTVLTMVVTKLPQRLRMAKKPTTNSTTVKTIAMMNDQVIHPDTLW